MRTIGGSATGSGFSVRRGRGSVGGAGRKKGSCGLWVLARATHGTFRGPRQHLALQARLTVALGAGQEYLLGRRKVDKGNSGWYPYRDRPT